MVKGSALKFLQQMGNLFQHKNKTCGFCLLRMESIKPKNEVYFFMVQSFKTLAESLFQRFMSPPQQLIINYQLSIYYFAMLANVPAKRLVIF